MSDSASHIAPMDATAKPPFGIAEQIAPLVRRVLARNPSAFTYTGTQTYIVGDGDAVAVIDPGPGEEDHVAAIVAAVGNARIVALCCTHTHKDHSPAVAPLVERTGAPVIGCAFLALDDDGPRSDAPFDQTYRPDRVLADGEAISGPGWTLRAVATPGHTSNHLCYALEGTGALFTGDHVMGWSTTVVSPPDGDMTAYMDSLQKLYDRQDAVYFPAHGPPVEKPRQFVRGMIGHRRQREAQIIALIEDGVREIPAMVPRMYKGVDKRLWPAAERSVLAHLIDLERRLRVDREGDTWKIG